MWAALRGEAELQFSWTISLVGDKQLIPLLLSIMQRNPA